MRFVILIIYLLGGYLAVGVLANLALSPVALFHHVDRGDQQVAGFVGGLIGLLVGFGRWRQRHDGLTSTVHGSAQFASVREIRATLARPQGLIVGRERRRGGSLLGYDGPAHLITLAPTRSGKGVGAIIPNLLTADRSIFCVDPKGENARAAARARRRFGPVHVLDPFEITCAPTASFNPLSRLAPDSPDLAEDAAVLAEALVHDPPGQVGEVHWNEEAKALIASLILYIVCHKPAHERTLAAVREALSSSPQDFRALLGAMQHSPHGNGLIRRAANRHLGKSDREAAGVLSSAQRHTHFLDSARINRAMAASDFQFADLKIARVTVFLVLPPERLDTYARWLRLLVAQAIHELARIPNRPGASVLFLLDEFAALGRLEAVERAFGLMAGYGLQLWPILQDMHQLWGAYGERAGTFLSNAGLVQIFNVADLETATWVSRSLGATTIAYETSGSSISQSPNQLFSTHASSTSTHLSRRDLLTPDEVMRLDGSLEILLRPGQPPALAQKVRYYADPEFVGLADP
jgi:type IV secretion system protein VirD4